jgi:catechol 2,3-dioxygenase-like lactoylglutathione lyase family enzyme
MEIGAHLHHVHLLSGDPAACAAFYGRIYAMTVEATGANWLCIGPERRLMFSRGTPNQLAFAAYAFPSANALADYRRMVQSRTNVEPATTPFFGEGAFQVKDPDGNTLVFGIAKDAQARAQAHDATPPGRVQHTALRSSNLGLMLAFYRDALSFTVSDRVCTDEGELRACFLRTDAEHHALALFHSPEQSHDHLSFETTSVVQLRDWADWVSRFDAKIVWGIGRHGPGNDVFFMIRDPDGNLAEISTELEICAPARDEGRWRHEERTLNLWGGAIMRS